MSAKPLQELKRVRVTVDVWTSAPVDIELMLLAFKSVQQYCDDKGIQRYDLHASVTTAE